jgi:hypothetical protein
LENEKTIAIVQELHRWFNFSLNLENSLGQNRFANLDKDITTMTEMRTKLNKDLAFSKILTLLNERESEIYVLIEKSFQTVWNEFVRIETNRNESTFIIKKIPDGTTLFIF